MSMQMGKFLAMTAVSGLVAGVAGCGGSEQAPAAGPEAHPAGSGTPAAAPAAAAKHACKGQNACKGQGFSATSEKACAAMGAPHTLQASAVSGTPEPHRSHCLAKMILQSGRRPDRLVNLVCSLRELSLGCASL